MMIGSVTALALAIALTGPPEDPDTRAIEEDVAVTVYLVVPGAEEAEAELQADIVDAVRAAELPRTLPGGGRLDVVILPIDQLEGGYRVVFKVGDEVHAKYVCACSGVELRTRLVPWAMNAWRDLTADPEPREIVAPRPPPPVTREEAPRNRSGTGMIVGGISLGLVGGAMAATFTTLQVRELRRRPGGGLNPLLMSSAFLGDIVFGVGLGLAIIGNDRRRAARLSFSPTSTGAVFALRGRF